MLLCNSRIFQSAFTAPHALSNTRSAYGSLIYECGGYNKFVTYGHERHPLQAASNGNAGGAASLENTNDTANV